MGNAQRLAAANRLTTASSSSRRRSCSSSSCSCSKSSKSASTGLTQRGANPLGTASAAPAATAATTAAFREEGAAVAVAAAAVAVVAAAVDEAAEVRQLTAIIENATMVRLATAEGALLARSGGHFATENDHEFWRIMAREFAAHACARWLRWHERGGHEEAWSRPDIVIECSPTLSRREQCRLGK